MAKYLYGGFRDMLFSHTGVSSGSLTELYPLAQIREKLRAYNGRIIVAIYTDEHLDRGNNGFRNNLVGCNFYKGVSRGVSRNNLSFDLSHIEIPVNTLLDVLTLSDLELPQRPYRQFAFETLESKIPLNTRYTDPANAYLKILRDEDYPDVEMKLKSVIEDKYKLDNLIHVSKSEFSNDIKVERGFGFVNGVLDDFECN